jgi:ribosomal protein S4
MKTQVKFKSLAQFTQITTKKPLRILKFKRPKWIKAQRNIKAAILQPKFLVDVNIIKTNLKGWDKVKSYYKKKVIGKQLLSHFNNNAVFFKHISLAAEIKKNRKAQILQYFVFSLYRIDQLLLNLKIFTSSSEARQSINSGHVQVNHQIVSKNKILKKGDYISFLSCDSYNHDFFTNISNKFLCENTFLTFVEFDPYLKSVVVIKDLEDLAVEDTLLICSEYLNVKTFQ